MKHPGDGAETFNARDFRQGTVVVVSEAHLTGGLRARLIRGGWSLHPVRTGGELASLHPLSMEQLRQLAHSFGLRVFGGDETSDLDSPLPTRIWTPLYAPPTQRMQPADEWGAIAHTTGLAGDEDYAKIARHVAVSLHASSIRLRDGSDQYHRQLLAALQRGQQPGRRFSNVPLLDLHLAFHSLLSEMASARDYLATAAARQVGAPARIDALSRLVDWASAPNRAEIAAHPVVAAMLHGWDNAGPDPWLYELTDYRNVFLHKEPLGASETARFLCLYEREANGVTVPRIALHVPAPLRSNQTCDALERFVELHERLSALAWLAADHAPHLPKPPHFVVRS